jgi:hypothetical protein
MTTFFGIIFKIMNILICDDTYWLYAALQTNKFVSKKGEESQLLCMPMCWTLNTHDFEERKWENKIKEIHFLKH